MPYFALAETNIIKTIIIMQSKGAIRFVAILLLLASFWQLSFTLVTNIQEKKAQKYAEAKAEADRIAAEAQAEIVRIQAEAQAEANKKLSDSLTDQLVEYQKIEAWDGKLPVVQGSGNAFVDVSSLVGE